MKKGIAILASMSLLTFGLTACGTGNSSGSGSSGSTSDTSQSGSKKNITLTMWTHDNEYAKFFSAEEKVWAKQYPQYNITFKAQVFPGSGNTFWNKELSAMTSGSQLPNLLDLEISHFSMFEKPGLLSKYVMNLTPLMGDSIKDFDKLSPYTYQGKLYALESALSPVGYYYQPAIFKKYGINSPPKTWSEFNQDGQILAKHGIAMAPAGDNDATATFQTLYYEDGGQYFDSSGKLVLDKSKMNKVLTFIKQDINNGIFKEVTSNTFWGTSIYQMYQSGKIAGVIAPDWYLGAELKSSAPKMAGKWKLALLPKWPDSSLTTSTWGGTGIAVSKNTPNAKLAWSLLKFAYATKQGQIDRFKEIGYFPNMKSAMTDPSVLKTSSKYLGGQDIGTVWNSVAQSVPKFWQSPLENEFSTTLGNEITAVYSNKETDDQAYANVMAKMKQAANGF